MQTRWTLLGKKLCSWVHVQLEVQYIKGQALEEELRTCLHRYVMHCKLGCMSYNVSVLAMWALLQNTKNSGVL